MTVTVDGLGAIAGAVYRPSAVISPQLMPLHPAPIKPQITTSFAAPVVLNCSCAPGFSCAEEGDTITEAAATFDRAINKIIVHATL
ncbi:MAG: hypothetical protein JO347_10720 [Candidatus Eremiobacteraeota bacterium]|nr:hypothetical protein [Candidatus Eremiobacteraeota bacterium]